jgi:cellulose biosynthesis protein BcsQ
MNMTNIILALGDKVAEDFIKNEAKNIKIIGLTSKLDGLVNLLSLHKPDILIIRDNLPGQEEFLETLLEIRTEFPNLRVIVIAAGRKIGDILLVSLVKNNIYDILYGEEINIYQVINLINRPLKFEDVRQLIDIIPEYKDLVSISHHKGQNVISCWGAFDTLGTSTTALNLAITYAKSGHKTILVELDDDKPCLNFLLGFGQMNLGTDTAVKGKLALESAITKIKKIQNERNPEIEWVLPLLKKIPNKLDFLMFSETYCFTKDKEMINLNNIRDLITSIVFHHDYDIIIFDLASNLNNEYTKIAFEMSNHILNLVIPDYAVLIHTRKIISQLELDNPGILKRLRLVLNQSLNEVIDIQSIFSQREIFKLPFCSNLRKGQTNDLFLPASLNPECVYYNQSLLKLIDNTTPNLLQDKNNIYDKKNSIIGNFKKIILG